MSNIYGKGAKGKATKLHAAIVRDHASCQSCGSTSNLQCAHIISRKYSRTRTDLDNAFCLCASCHAHFTDHPVDFGQFTIDQIGESNYDLLLEKRRSIVKMDWDVEAARLAEIAKGRGLI